MAENPNRIEQVSVAKGEYQQKEEASVYVPKPSTRLILAGAIAGVGAIPTTLSLAGVAVPPLLVALAAIVASILTGVAVELGMKAGTPK